MSTSTAPYSPAVRDLLKADRTPPLGAGTPVRTAGEKLRALNLTSLFAPATVRDRTMASACLSGLWLWFDYLDESHSLSQEIHTAEGSFWHGIMHRREGDFANAKYWFARVRRHPVHWPLAESAVGLARGVAGAPAWLARGPWDVDAFIDLCEECVTGRTELTTLCESLQRREWEVLFDHCYQRALGAGEGS
jgi:hypothetical protein